MGFDDQDQSGWDAGEVVNDFDPGWHDCTIKFCKDKENRSTKGHHLYIGFQGLSGEWHGENYNYDNASQNAQRRAQQNLTALRLAIGGLDRLSTTNVIDKRVGVRFYLDDKGELRIGEYRPAAAIEQPSDPQDEPAGSDSEKKDGIPF